MVGRDEQCSFQIVDTQISRRHLQIRLDEDQNRHYAIDFESHNGVHVGGKKIETDTLLEDGDVIEIGASKIVYSLEDVPDAQSVRDLLRKRGEGRQTTVLPD